MGLTSETKRINGQPYGMAERVSTGAEGRHYSTYCSNQISQAGPFGWGIQVPKSKAKYNPISCMCICIQVLVCAINYCAAGSGT